MTPIKIVARGLSDTLESLLPYTLASLLWWPCLLSILPAPGATLALFRFTDPRFIAASYERPGLRDSIAYGIRSSGRAWKLALLLSVVGFSFTICGFMDLTAGAGRFWVRSGWFCLGCGR